MIFGRDPQRRRSTAGLEYLAAEPLRAYEERKAADEAKKKETKRTRRRRRSLTRRRRTDDSRDGTA